MTLQKPRLSAHSLGEHQRCARKFALAYKVGSFWPAPEGGAAREDAVDPLALGSAFHQLVQWHTLDLPLEACLAAWSAELPPLAGLWEAFLTSEHASPPAGARIFTEQTLGFFLAGAPFSARFDRLMLHDDTWTIVDWKTGHVSPKKLAESWQTKLYPFALVEAGHGLTGGAPIAPERVRLVYWQVATGKPVTFTYDAERHARAKDEFSALAETLLADFDLTLEDDTRFPRKKTHCKDCGFDALCNRPALSAREAPTLPMPRFEEAPR